MANIRQVRAGLFVATFIMVCASIIYNIKVIRRFNYNASNRHNHVPLSVISSSSSSSSRLATAIDNKNDNVTTSLSSTKNMAAAAATNEASPASTIKVKTLKDIRSQMIQQRKKKMLQSKDDENNTIRQNYAIELCDQSSLNTTITALNKSSTSNTKIIAFADSKYKDIAYRWYKDMTDLGYNEHMVVAYDKETEEYFKSHGSCSHTNGTIITTMRYDYIHSFYENNNNISNILTDLSNDCELHQIGKQMYRRRLFGSRWNYILRQLKSGSNVLVSDVDNYFVKYIDIRNEIEDNTDNYDTYLAYGGTVPSFPRRTFALSGFTACGCLSWWRASSFEVIQFVSELVRKCGCLETTLDCDCRCDDQIEMNNLLFNDPVYKIQWDNTANANVKNKNTNTNTNETGKIKREKVVKRNETRITNNFTVPKSEKEMFWGSMVGTGQMFTTQTNQMQRVKFWDRHSALRREYSENNNILLCPDSSKSWVTMPSNVERDKIKDTWLNGPCGDNSSSNK
jgi:hypothetical protein